MTARLSAAGRTETASLLLAVAASAADCESARVVTIVDGDTIKVEISGRTETLRIACVDTPETKHPQRPVERFGREASAFTEKLASGQLVCIYPDPDQPSRDRYGRLLGYVELPDGSDLGARIVGEGYGHVYRGGPCARKEEYKTLEEKASIAGRGLWGPDP